MMLLAVDVGNTHTHIGIFEGARLVENWEVSSARDRTADELGALLLQLLAQRGRSPADIRAAAVACVVPQVVETVARACREALGVEAWFLDPERSGVPILYEDPSEVGADRIANAAGGFARYGGPLVVVDFGTATTFDAVSAAGEYRGGAIAPGLQISIDALFQRAARLPRIALVRPAAAIGTNTVASMQAGIVFGYAGLVEALVSRVSAELEGEPRVVATGGLAELIVRETGAVAHVDRHLTLEGLRVLWERAGDAR